MKKEMDSLKDVNWSEATRKLLEEKIRRLKLLKKMDEMLKNIKLTDEDAIRPGREVNKAVAKRYRELTEEAKKSLTEARKTSDKEYTSTNWESATTEPLLT